VSISAVEASELFRSGPVRYLDTGSGEVAYRTVGTGPDVLFVHGWPVTSATFRKLLPHLADHVTCHLIDLPGAGSSRYTAGTPLTIDNHINNVRRSLDLLNLDDVAIVGHDSGGLIARHAMAGDPRLRALGLIDTEPSTGVSLKFRSFIAGRRVPGFGAALAWLVGRPRLRRSRLVLGDAFVDSSHLDGEFDEFFLQPIARRPEYRAATIKLLKSFDYRLIRELKDMQAKIDVPVQLVWGERDRFFPIRMAEAMVKDFPNARLSVVPGAGLFTHEERPAEVAEALLPTLFAPTLRP
jgi:pimeloyl-ACP methyl ester carboxylesterase